LNAYGSTLANIVVKKAMQKEAATFTPEEITSLNGLINSLLDDNGPIANIEKAYMQYILGYAASAAVQNDVDNGKDEAATAWKAVQGLVSANGATLESVVNGLASLGVTLPEALNVAIGKLNATKTAVSNAAGKMPSGKTEYVWAEISEAVGLLADIDKITVNGYAADEVKNNMSALVNSVASSGINVQMASGAGVYADIADHCRDYSSSIEIEELNSGTGIVRTGVKARMNTKTAIAPTYLSSCGTALTIAGSPTGTGTVMPISEFYGYIIDLAFRTNAVESNLLLQTTPVDRIYNDNTNEDTMGHGSTMTFQAVSNAFTNDQVKNLMSAIRVVFFDPNTNDIIAYAKLDTINASIGADGITANLYLYTTTTTYEITIEDTTYPVTKTGEAYTYVDGNGATQTLTAEQEKAVKKTVTETMITNEKDAKIIALQQNVATALSALVYLDGEAIGNDDVAATDAKSLTGTMNLQFSSSATLVPMEYADLHQPNAPEQEPNNP
jgi:hypothetical protein